MDLGRQKGQEVFPAGRIKVFAVLAKLIVQLDQVMPITYKTVITEAALGPYGIKETFDRWCRCTDSTPIQFEATFRARSSRM